MSVTDGVWFPHMLCVGPVSVGAGSIASCPGMSARPCSSCQKASAQPDRQAYSASEAHSKTRRRPRAALAEEARGAVRDAAELHGQLAALRARELAAQARPAPGGAPMLVARLDGVAAKDLSARAFWPLGLAFGSRFSQPVALCGGARGTRYGRWRWCGACTIALCSAIARMHCCSACAEAGERTRV